MAAAAAHGRRGYGGLDFSAIRARLRPCLDRVSLLDSVVDAVPRQLSSVVALTGRAGIGKSVLLGAALDRLEGAGYLIAQHFYGIQRSWDTPETVTASLRAKLEAALGPAMAAAAEPPRQAPSTPPPGTVTGTDEGASPRPGSGRRRALIIANSRYEDPDLISLPSAEVDGQAMADVLSDPSVAGFEVETLENATATAMRARVREFFSGGRADELLLLYFSGHGFVDAQQQLYLAAADTTPRDPRATAVPTRFVRDAMNLSRSSSTVLILDYAEGAIAAEAMRGEDAIVAQEATGAARQVVLLSASQAVGDFVEGSPSPFTRLIVEGLSGGRADLDGDGTISVEELYEYIRRQWRETSGPGALYPSISTSGAQGAILLARRTDDGLIAAQAHREPAAPPPRVLPAATLQAAAAAARQAGLRGIVIALDGLPGSSEEEVDRFLLEQVPIAGLLPPGVSVLISTRNGRGGRYREAFGTDAAVFDVDDSSTEQVCRLLLDWKRDELASAFVDPVELEELIRFSGGVPGRLHGIIDWLGDQRVGSVRLTDLPPALSASADMMWDKVQAQGQHHELGVIAVAGPDLTMADLTATLAGSADPAASSPGVEWTLSTCAQLVEAVADLRLVRLDGWSGEPGTVVTVSHASVAAAFADRFAAETTAAHGRHVAAFPYHDPSSAGPYQIANAAYHHVRYGEPGRAAQLATSGGYLDLRQRSAGVDALAADLAELAALAVGSPDTNKADLVRRAVVTSLSAARAEPDCFVDLVGNGMRAIGAADLAEIVFAPSPAPSCAPAPAHHDRSPRSPAYPRPGRSRSPRHPAATARAAAPAGRSVSGLPASCRYRYPYPQNVLLAAFGTPSPYYRTRRTFLYQPHPC